MYLLEILDRYQHKLNLLLALKNFLEDIGDCKEELDKCNKDVTQVLLVINNIESTLIALKIDCFL